MLCRSFLVSRAGLGEMTVQAASSSLLVLNAVRHPGTFLGPQPSPLFSHPTLILQAFQGTPQMKSGPQVPLCPAAKHGPHSCLSSYSWC